MINPKDTATQVLPMPGAGPQMRHVARRSIVSSLTNPRKHFDPAKLKELADNIRASDVHQPVLLRPLPASRLEETFLDRQPGEALPEYELVCGERRWRACALADKDEIPALIREMTDAQALEAQVVENLQREDVTELEEAEGYEVLMQTGGINADQVAAKIGKSRSYVYSRLKLLDLGTKGRTALREQKIDASKALLIARIPDEALQLQALKFCVEGQWHGGPPSYRDCAQHIQQNYMLKLSDARFKITDESLVKGAPSCKDCSKRTGANPDLFNDVKSADVCTDPKCFHTKEDAAAALLIKEAKDKGQTVIAGKKAEEITTQNYNGVSIKGYRQLDAADDSPTGQPLRKIIGKLMIAEGIQPVKIQHPRKKGELIDALPNDVVSRLLKAVEGQAKASEQVTKEAQQFADEKKAKAEEKAKAKYEQAWRDGLLASTWQELQKGTAVGFTVDVHRHLMQQAVSNLSADDARAVCEVLGLGKVAGHSGLMDFAKATEKPSDLHLLCMMQKASSAYDHAYNRRANDGLMLVAEAMFADQVAEVIKTVKASAAAQHLPKIERKKAAAPKADAPHKPAAQAAKARGEKSKKSDPAALARDKSAPKSKTTKAEATADIAAALAELDAKDQAAAPQGDEAQADAQPAGGSATDNTAAQASDPAAINAPAAQGNDAPANALPAATSAKTDDSPALTPQAAWPFPTVSKASKKALADAAKQASAPAAAEAKEGAAVASAGKALAFEPGQRVKVKDSHVKASYRGREGAIRKLVSPERDTWHVALDAKKEGSYPTVDAFVGKDLEVLA